MGDSAFNANLLQLLRERKDEIVMPISPVTEPVFMAILRAVVDLGLAPGASPQSIERRAMCAACGYLLYVGKDRSPNPQIDLHPLSPSNGEGFKESMRGYGV